MRKLLLALPVVPHSPASGRSQPYGVCSACPSFDGQGRWVMKLTARLMCHGLWIAVILFSASTLCRAQEYSHARIVRLSFVEGTVTVEGPEVEEWAEALVNTPIQEGFKVSTGEDGFAEVEFENASTARLGQLSLLEFTQLVLAPSGGKVNRLRLRQGYATFNFIPEDDDFYEVTAGDATLTPHGKSRFRLDMEEGLLLVKVFKGSVEITSPEGSGTVGKNAMLELRRGEEPVFQITQGITKDAWDEWVEDRESQVELVRHREGIPVPYSNDVTSLLYGFVDLARFGEWVVLPGYGTGWAPDVGGGWAPYTWGRWCWYPGYGYTWISSEPWGWLPYHYGQWIYQPGYGWCWLPTSFHAWSPALVTWYRGPGWVGWAPQGSPRLTGGVADCSRSSGCGATVSEDAFRHGRPVTAEGLLQINPEAEGRHVGRPDIEPGRLARLPGEPFRRAGVPALAQEPVSRQAGVSTGQGVSDRTRQATPAASAPVGRQLPSSPRSEPGVSAERGSASGGIVFDSEERRYVNNPAPGVRPSAEGAPQAASSGGAASQATQPASRTVPSEARGGRPVDSLVGAHRPGPQGNYPVSTAAPPVGRAGEVGDRAPSSSGTSRSEAWGSSVSHSTGSSLGTSGSRSTGGRSSQSSSSARATTGSSSRSGDSSSSRISGSSGSSSGGQSSVGSSSSSGAWSSSSGSSGSSRSTATSDGGSRSSRDTFSGASSGSSGDYSSRSSDSSSSGSSHSSISVDRGSSSRESFGSGSRGASDDGNRGSGGRPPR